MTGRNAMMRLASESADGLRKQPKMLLSIDDALTLNPVGLFQYRLLLMCGLGFMSDALEVNLLTYLSTCASAEWELTNAQTASITGIVFAGIFCGTLFWGVFADKYGRKSTYLSACVMIIFGGFLSGVSPSYEWLVFFRAIAGFGIGGTNVPFDLLAEFLPASHRGTFLVCIQYFWTLGSLFVNGLAWMSLSSRGWRFLAYVTAVPVTLASAVSFLYLPESPRWLLTKGRRHEAQQVIRDAAVVNGVAMEPFRLVHDSKDEHVEDAGYLDLLRDRDLVRVSLPLWTIWSIFGFTYYGIILFVNRLYSTRAIDGSTSVEELSCDFDYFSIFLNSASEVIGCTMGALVIDRWGRVASQWVFYTLGGVAVLAMGFTEDASVLLLAGMLGRLSALAASNATWVSTPELYTTEMRTVGHATCLGGSKIGAFLSPYLVVSNASPAVVGIILGGMNFLGAAASLLLPETKDASLDFPESEVPKNPYNTVAQEEGNRASGSGTSSRATSRPTSGHYGTGNIEATATHSGTAFDSHLSEAAYSFFSIPPLSYFASTISPDD